jgi:peptidoglycan/LPS O-acetylase OafA/YrhL
LPGPGKSSTLRRVTDAPPAAGKPARVDEFDGLRGILALWVALSHIAAWTGYWENPLPGRLKEVWQAFVSAEPAVDTFIILSGFVISFLIHHRRQSYAAFMRGRFFRIYPVYAVCLGLGIATSFLVPAILQTAPWRGDTIYYSWMADFVKQEQAAFGSHVFWKLTLLNGLLTREILPAATVTLLAPAWSITLEWQYYLVAPLLARGVKSAFGLLAIAAIAWLGLEYASHWRNPQLSFLPAQLPLFLIGIASYHLYHARCEGPAIRFLPSLAPAALIALAVCSGWHPVALTAWAVGFGCIMVRGNDPFSRLLALARRLLLHPALQHLGKLSFPLYLVHWPVILLLLTALLKIRPGISGPLALASLVVVGIPVILLTAEIIHRLVEKPGMNLGKRFDRKR